MGHRRMTFFERKGDERTQFMIFPKCLHKGFIVCSRQTPLRMVNDINGDGRVNALWACHGGRSAGRRMCFTNKRTRYAYAPLPVTVRWRAARDFDRLGKGAKFYCWKTKFTVKRSPFVDIFRDLNIPSDKFFVKIKHKKYITYGHDR